jgi:hypothetical protein
MYGRMGTMKPKRNVSAAVSDGHERGNNATKCTPENKLIVAVVMMNDCEERH